MRRMATTLVDRARGVTPGGCPLRRPHSDRPGLWLFSFLEVGAMAAVELTIGLERFVVSHAPGGLYYFEPAAPADLSALESVLGEKVDDSPVAMTWPQVMRGIEQAITKLLNAGRKAAT